MDHHALRAVARCNAERPVVRRRRLHDSIEHALLLVVAAAAALSACKGIAVGLSLIFAAAASAL